MKLRTLIFWPHLVAGVLAGLVILVMCVTGVLLTYERQILAWADSGFRSTVPSDGVVPQSPESLLARLRTSHPQLAITGLVLRSTPDAPVTINAGPRTLFADRYTGDVLGESSKTGVRSAMTSLRGWHRWLAVDGENRPIAKAITGWSNALFLFMVVSGIYLWFPRQWTGRHLKSVTFFTGGLRGKARDFNWHNVIGIWSAVPLLIVVASAVPISFPWANAFVYRVMGEPAPVQGGERGAAPGGSAPRGTDAANAERERQRPGQGGSALNADRAGSPQVASLDGLDAVWTRAERHVQGWQTITLRIPTSPRAPYVFAIDRGNGGQPHLRSTLTLDRRNGEVVSDETFSSLTPARRIRNVMRFAHTGEVLGIPGQTIAGIASAGGGVLVWTGLALAWRRLRAWMKRRAERTVPVSIPPRTSAAFDPATE